MTRDEVLAKLVAHQLSGDPGFLTSCCAARDAWEYPEGGHGVCEACGRNVDAEIGEWINRTRWYPAPHD